MNFYKIFNLICLLVGTYTVCNGQIKYKIALVNGVDLYQISIVCEEDINYPNNIIGTAQISIKAPITDFEFGAVTNLINNVQWEHNAIITSPKEAIDFQYLSFGLASAGVKIPLEANTEIPLFTFKNRLGKCPGAIILVDNKTDVFLPPNSKNANIGNQISLLASSLSKNQNAYIGNIDGGIADCSFSTNLEEGIPVIEEVSLELYPNPTSDWINAIIPTTNLEKEEIQLQLRKVDGSMLQEHILAYPFQAKEVVRFEVNSLAGGEYIIYLAQNNKIFSKQFIKVK